jgi:hypothetical protein
MGAVGSDAGLVEGGETGKNRVDGAGNAGNRVGASLVWVDGRIQAVAAESG